MAPISLSVALASPVPPSRTKPKLTLADAQNTVTIQTTTLRTSPNRGRLPHPNTVPNGIAPDLFAASPFAAFTKFHFVPNGIGCVPFPNAQPEPSRRQYRIKINGHQTVTKRITRQLRNKPTKCTLLHLKVGAFQSHGDRSGPRPSFGSRGHGTLYWTGPRSYSLAIRK